MSKRLERKIQQIYNQIFKKIFNRTNIKNLMHKNVSSIQLAVLNLENSKMYNDFCVKFSKELSKIGLANKKGIWKHYYQAAKDLGIQSIPSTYKDYEYKQMRNAIDKNFTMIKSMPQKVLEVLEKKYTTLLIEQVANGTLGRQTFQKELFKHGSKNARLIARTETAKLQTAIEENRATTLGSVCYRWIASNDRRTRQSHRNMNNVIVFWRQPSQKPLLDNMRGNAGEFPNCRCDAQAILDISELTENNYKVYDYNTDKIVSMSKSQLIDVIQKGFI